ncbi:MAG: 6-phosphogluconolactonase [Bacteroidales bacterium]|jgi:6-phosphogluconolactonase|nr:6-phosphogluconolactonase [Bacteroidales bacterium]
MDRLYKIYPTPESLAEAFAGDMVNMIKESEKKRSVFTVVLSGGNTPRLLFSVLAGKYIKSVDWSLVHFFWGDERCVPPEDPESNYGVAFQFFLSKIEIPGKNIHRIRGEDEPEREAVRYSEEITAFVRTKNNYPAFDLIILGMGDDGHTASIFPRNMELLDSDDICKATVHPVTGQRRITITGKVINNSDLVIFLVTGQNKAKIIDSIFNKRADLVTFPASFIVPLHGKEIWLLDKQAGKYIG